MEAGLLAWVGHPLEKSASQPRRVWAMVELEDDFQDLVLRHRLGSKRMPNVSA